MKITSVIFVLLIVLILTFNLGATALAKTGLSTELLTDEESNNFLKNVNISYVLYESKKEAIDCFDVNDNGMIAIGYGSGERKTASVYTTDGTYEYGFEFNCTGSFEVEWSAKNLIIYFVRSDIAVELNPNGAVISVSRIQDTVENNRYWRSSIDITKRNVGGVEYRLKNNMGFFNLFSSNYSQLVAVESDGEERVLYNVNNEHMIETIALFLFVVAFVGTIIGSIVYACVKFNKDKKIQEIIS